MTLAVRLLENGCQGKVHKAGRVGLTQQTKLRLPSARCGSANASRSQRHQTSGRKVRSRGKEMVGGKKRKTWGLRDREREKREK